MPLKSDITINAPQFDAASAPKGTLEANNKLTEMMKEGPKWFEVGAAKYREMRWNNQTPLPRPPVIESGVNFKIPSRDSGRELPCRMFKPENGEPKGVFLHIHGGGFTLNSEGFQDGYLKFLADNMTVTVISVGYRLAPEDPFPAAPNDCVDAAEYLLKEGAKYGGKLLFIGGESAGGHLSVVTTFELLRTHSEPLPLKGLILNYGVYDCAVFLPQAHTIATPAIINLPIMFRYNDAFAPNTTIEQRRDPMYSPIYENLFKFKGRLPPALFTCGTEDPLLDDTTLMSLKWMAAGGEAVVKIYPGAPHGFSLFPAKMYEAASQVNEHIKEFMLEKL
ncbi:acetyl esterase [Rhizodiscina lignyota]|uniref:Acetyl esterase n=1 Tax=Rhizodiscina lignyota TaxID=1504668 RepID=A0A9P4I7P8_9PEZI|nr:acetyl esterase [Rhizodiscina lignyota]